MHCLTHDEAWRIAGEHRLVAGTATEMRVKHYAVGQNRSHRYAVLRA
jgi:hypothetical protein